MIGGVMHNQANYHAAIPTRKGLAIASLVLGLISIPTFGLLLVGAVLSIILGILAMRKANSNPTQYGGKGLAIAGIIASTFSLFIVMLAALAIPHMLKSQQAARDTAALLEVLTIGKAQMLYSATKGRGKFTDLRTLGAQGLIDSALASGQKGGYMFRSEAVFSERGTPMFNTIAKPVEAGTFGTGNHSFASNETFKIYEAEGAVDLKSTPTNRIPIGGTEIVE
jgi:type II secretory pathway pseudopilin PulG